MSLLRRGAVGLVLTALAAAGLVPAAHADNLESDTVVGGTAALGNVCRGATATGSVGFVLKRNGNSAGQVWAASALVTVSPGSQPSGFTLGSTSVTTPSNWASIGNNALVDAGDASYSLSVPANAATGARSASVTYNAAGSGSDGGTTTRSTPVSFTWNVVDCTPADTTAPVISKVLTPVAPDGANGWYRSNVAVDWTVADPESSFTTQGCVDASLTQDGTLTSSCSASSPGGSAGPVSVTLKRDATAPVLTPVVTGDLGDNGWYVGDVAVSWTASDATAGIDPATTCAPAALAADAASRTFSCSVSDLAGNVATSVVTVKRDATDPVIVSHVAGTSGSDGWYTSDVDVTWDVSDATSSIASKTGCDKVTLDHDSAGTSYTCTAKDTAGNTTSSTVEVKRDATAPSATFTLDGAQGDNAWFRGPVTVGWTVSDGLSGLDDVKGCVDQVVAGDGRHELTCAVSDAAGNTTHSVALVDIDGSAPVITPDVSGPQKGTEWFTGDASVTWTVTDPTSGVARTTGCDDATVTEDTDGITFTCSATDNAGNGTSESVTVKRDATAPVVQSDVSGTRNGDWFTGDATVAWKVSDATSGIGSRSGCDTVALDQDTRGKTYTCSVTDRAGNPASASETLKRDTTAPLITPHVQGPKKGTDWFTGDVSVTWTVTDPTSDVATTAGCDAASVTADTDGTTYTCVATDKAGNGTSESVTVQRDATAPVVTPHATGTHNGDWFTGDVAVTWTVTDATSGVAKAVGCDEVTLGTDTLEQAYSCTATDGAGNQTDGSTTVKRDATAPVITADVQGPSKGTEWFTGDVSVSWTVTDATSGLATITGCGEATVTADTDGTTYTCAATDNAGNGTSRSVTVKRDATAPVVEPDVSGTRNGDWFTGDATVAWKVSDATSGIATRSGCDTATHATDSGGTTYTCSATDRAGNKASGSATVKRDATKPVITADVTGPSKVAGWFNGDVAVTWTVTDATSGVATQSHCDEVRVTEDTVGATYTCGATDVAGNQSSKSVTVKRDATAPTLDLTGGPVNGATYSFGDVPSISTCVATDVVSQLAGPCTVTNDGVLVGSHTQVATATDNAGNVTKDLRRYTVAAWRLDGFYKPVTMGATVVNTVKAGSTVPLKFNVYKGTVPMTSGIGAVFVANKVSCDGSDLQDPVDFVTTGGTSLRYDATAGQWVQNWATPSGGKGSCYRVTLTTADGSTIAADFVLK